MVEGDVLESFYDPFDIDDGEDVQTSKSYQTIDQCMKTEINGIIRNLSNDERIQRILSQNTRSKGSFAKKTGCRPQGVKKILLVSLTISLSPFQVFQKQSEIANELLLKIQERSSNLQDFVFFDFYIFVPKFKNLGKDNIKYCN